jgi:simple sugar transport system ATP-binding protein
MKIAERVTVLRDGHKIGVYMAQELDDRKLAYLMTGKEIKYTHQRTDFHEQTIALKVKDLSKEGQYSNVSFRLHKGEILGLIGVLGSGRTEIALSLFGMNFPEKGEITIGGKIVRLNSNSESIAHKISYVPEDRLGLGVVLDQPIHTNLILTTMNKLLNPFKLIDRKKTAEMTAQAIDELKIKVSDQELPVRTLSGGNQQRIVLAKWLATNPKVLILDSPTVGVDIAAKSGIYEIIKRLASKGIGILLISDEVHEVLYNCHRVLVMRKGTIIGEFHPGQISEYELVKKINEK